MNLKAKKEKGKDNAVRQFNTEKLEVIPSWAKASLAFSHLDDRSGKNAQKLSPLTVIFQTA